jgi:hypothetical protein
MGKVQKRRRILAIVLSGDDLVESRSAILSLNRDVTLLSYLVEISGSLILTDDPRRIPFSLQHEERNSG